MNKVQKTLNDDNPYRGIIGVLKVMDYYGLGDLVRDENAETHLQDDALSRKVPALYGGFPGVAAFLGHGFCTLIGSHGHENVEEWRVGFDHARAAAVAQLDVNLVAFQNF